MLVVVQEYENLPPRRRHVLGADGELEVGLAAALAAADPSAPHRGDAGRRRRRRGRRRPDGLAVRPEPLLACWQESPGSLRSAEWRKGRTFGTLSFHQAGLPTCCWIAVTCFIPLLLTVVRSHCLVGWNGNFRNVHAI